MQLKRRTKRLIRLVALVAIFAVSAFHVQTYAATPVMAYDATSELEYYGDNNVNTMTISNRKMEGIAHYLVGSYKPGQRFKGKGQCFGYAEKVRKMFGSSYKQRRVGKKITKKVLYNALKGRKPGTHLRMAAKKNGGGRVHSVSVLKVTKKYIWYTDANMDYRNGIWFSKVSLTDFAGWGRSRYGYIVWTREPKGKVPTVNKTAAVAYADANGPDTRVAWRPVRKANSYIVYRSSSKKSGYKKVATVKSCSYLDRSTDLYGRTYYKVKAVISKNKGSMSKPALAYRRVKAPKAYLTDKGNGTYEITWNQVHGATKHNIYVYNPSTGKNSKKVTTGASWTYKTDKLEADLYITAEGARSGSESYPVHLYYSNYDWSQWEVVQ